MRLGTLQSLDRFLHDHATTYPDLNAAAFQAWCHTQEKLASGVRRVRMLQVYNLCLYRRRTEPHCFLPDPSAFPPYHQRLQPYIFSEDEVARLLRAASGLNRVPSSPLRPEVIRLAIVLLFTTGIRRGELLRLILSDYNRQNSTLLIRESKFYKSRLLPINSDIVYEIEQYLDARARRQLPTSSDTPLIWNAAQGGRAYSGTCLRLCLQAAAPAMRHCHSERKAAADSRLSPRLCRKCPATLVPNGRRCRGQTAVAGNLSGARLGSIDALLLAVHRAAPYGRQRAVCQSLRFAGLCATARGKEAQMKRPFPIYLVR